MNRFRPNLVVTGCRPFEEDVWKRIRIGGVELAIVKPCPRCVVTTIDQETLAKGQEPLRTLHKFRQQAGGAMFGQNAIPHTLPARLPFRVIEHRLGRNWGNHAGAQVAVEVESLPC